MIEVSCYISSDGWVFLLTPRTKILLVLPQKKKRINNYKYRWSCGRESACQCRRHIFDTWSWKILHAVEQLSPGGWVPRMADWNQSFRVICITITLIIFLLEKLMMCRLPYDHMVSQGSKEPNSRFPVPDHHFIIQEDLDLSLMGG